MSILSRKINSKFITRIAINIEKNSVRDVGQSKSFWEEFVYLFDKLILTFKYATKG